MAEVLLHIVSQAENCIDECLIVVSENYDADEVLEQISSDGVVEEPKIAETIDLDENTLIHGFRPFYG